MLYRIQLRLWWSLPTFVTLWFLGHSLVIVDVTFGPTLCTYSILILGISIFLWRIIIASSHDVVDI